MSLHQVNKQRNRERILAAADEIIRNQGLDALSMRYLADYAGVSLRTPYNLFSSKTEIIAELLQRTLSRLAGVGAPGDPVSQAVQSAPRGLEQLLELLEGMRAAETELGQVRDMFREVMLAPEQHLRDQGIAYAAQLIRPAIALALAQKQLRPETDEAALTRHLQVLLMAILGMWAAGQLTWAEVICHAERSWVHALLLAAGPAEAKRLRARLQSL